MKIITYKSEYQQQIIDLILHIQNQEAGINLTIEEQPDLFDIQNFYIQNGGNFWIALNDNKVIGTLAVMNYGNKNAVLKKFFVKSEYRNKKIGLALFNTLIDYVKNKNFKRILLDTPSVAKASHKFYENAGFVKIEPKQLPFNYEYPDRDSLLYLLNL